MTYYQPHPYDIAGVETIRLNRVESGITDSTHPGYNLKWGVYV